jgi:hypothetical protein
MHKIFILMMKLIYIYILELKKTNEKNNKIKNNRYIRCGRVKTSLFFLKKKG